VKNRTHRRGVESSIYEHVFVLTDEKRSRNFKYRGRRTGMAKVYETDVEIMEDIDIMQQHDDYNM
jgi:hypothetical protein